MGFQVVASAALIACAPVVAAPATAPDGDSAHDRRVSPEWPDFTREELRIPVADSLYARTLESLVIEPRSEPSIAFDPANPQRMVAAYPDLLRIGGTPVQTCARRYSTDGGRSWVSAQTQPPLDRPWGDCSNTVVAADHRGHFYNVTMTYDENEVLTHEYLNASADGGRTWEVRALLGNNHPGDYARPFMTIDQVCGPKRLAVDTGAASPHRGRIYYFTCAHGVDVGGGQKGSPVTLRHSDDGGTTFTAPLPIGAQSAAVRAGGAIKPGEILIGPDGTVTLVFAVDLDGPDYAIGITSSRDGGRSFGPLRMVPGTMFPFTRRGVIPDERWRQGRQWQHLYNGLSVRGAITPDGRVWIAYAANSKPQRQCLPPPRGTFCRDSDVLLVSTGDGGRTWSAPVAFADDRGGADQFLPALSAHPDGTVSLAWLDKRRHRSGFVYDAYYTNTRDGRHFLPPVRLSSASSRLARGDDLDHGDSDDFYNINFLGDWQDSDAADDTFTYIWSDMRAGASSQAMRPKEIWHATIRLCPQPRPGHTTPLCSAADRP